MAGTSQWSGARAALMYAVGVALVIFSGALAPVPAYAVIFGVCLLLGLGLGALVRDPSGLRDHHQ